AQREAEQHAAARREQERQAAAQREAERQAAARQAEARAAAKADATAEAERREERLKAIGRQLNEEADRRDAAARAAALLPSSVSTVRRGRLLGRIDPNAELVRYAEAWARKIQLNLTFDAVREPASQPHTDPVVTVALRADGTVESISFVRGSGVPALDEAIRRVVHSQAPYPAFPSALARDYDVVEIRRTWSFDMAIRLN
ncbi:MAG: hypothetical protein CFE45_15365, partial [Burkholderiales bacterium PBB5]